MSIVITGVTGLLGSSLLNHAADFGYDAIQLTRDDIANMKSPNDLAIHLTSYNVKVLIHCAANTNVEFCEDNKVQCYKDNVALTEKLALVCKIMQIKFVFISSTGVYGKYQDTPYIDYDDVNPTTIHHKSKVIAESVVSKLVSDYLIIRTGWLFGGSWDMSKNFVANRIKEAYCSEGYIKSDASQVGNPTFVDDLSSNIFNLIEKKYSGMFNCVNTGRASRFDYVTEIIKLSGLNVSVLPVDGTSFNRKAKVSHNESAINLKLDYFGINMMPCWKKSLAQYIESIRSEYE
jgi:dTDP-4-dehydrorhamnose reductase